MDQPGAPITADARTLSMHSSSAAALGVVAIESTTVRARRRSFAARLPEPNRSDVFDFEAAPGRLRRPTTPVRTQGAAEHAVARRDAREALRDGARAPSARDDGDGDGGDGKGDNESAWRGMLADGASGRVSRETSRVSLAHAPDVPAPHACGARHGGAQPYSPPSCAVRSASAAALDGAAGVSTAASAAAALAADTSVASLPDHGQRLQDADALGALGAWPDGPEGSARGVSAAVRRLPALPRTPRTPRTAAAHIARAAEREEALLVAAMDGGHLFRLLEWAKPDALHRLCAHADRAAAVHNLLAAELSRGLPALRHRPRPLPPPPPPRKPPARLRVKTQRGGRTHAPAPAPGTARAARFNWRALDEIAHGAWPKSEALGALAQPPGADGARVRALHRERAPHAAATSPPPARLVRPPPGPRPSAMASAPRAVALHDLARSALPAQPPPVRPGRGRDALLCVGGHPTVVPRHEPRRSASPSSADDGGSAPSAARSLPPLEWSRIRKQGRTGAPARPAQAAT
ncbi:hypothetical protein KFE25_011440 [Diacronema lutheri]|uniref:Uncharacterized protein n=1 Tax=Diacronema lutheri TaxID=2081491 RepID=A0A8J5XDE5_DIALT|nr:hypothetical protein KFE25_011440 [Diacronema lutheri]